MLGLLRRSIRPANLAAIAEKGDAAIAATSSPMKASLRARRGLVSQCGRCHAPTPRGRSPKEPHPGHRRVQHTLNELFDGFAAPLGGDHNTQVEDESHARGLSGSAWLLMNATHSPKSRNLLTNSFRSKQRDDSASVASVDVAGVMARCSSA